MINTQYINLNMVPSGVMPVLYVSQYDVGRPLGMVVYNSSEAVDLDSYTCTIEATRTDGTAITAAVTTDDNIGAFVTTATMTNKADKYPAKLVLFDSNSRRVASLAFVMCVTPATMDENAESIEEDRSLYQQYTDAVQAALADIREDIADLRSDFNAHLTDVEKYKAYVTPQMYGAKGDGVQDDTTYLRQAITDGTARGKIVLIPEGSKILWTSPIFLPSNLILCINGELVGGTTNNSLLETFDRVTSTPGYSASHDILICGTGTVNMQGQTYTTEPTPFRIHHAQHVTIKDITIADVSQYHAIEIGGSKNILIDGVKFKGMHKSAAQAFFEFIQLEAATEAGAQYAIPYDGTMTESVTVRNCYFGASENGGECYTAIGCHSGVETESFNHVVFENNLVDMSIGIPIVFGHDVNDVKIVGNTFRETVTDPAPIGGIAKCAVVKFLYHCAQTEIKNNDFTSTNARFIFFGSSVETTSIGVVDVSVCSNIFGDYGLGDHNDALGIFISCGVFNLTITDNVFNNSQTYMTKPVHIPAASLQVSTRLVVANNVFNTEGTLDATNYNRYTNLSSLTNLYFTTSTSDPASIQTVWGSIPTGRFVSGVLKTSGSSYSFTGFKYSELYGAILLYSYNNPYLYKLICNNGTFTRYDYYDSVTIRDLLSSQSS